MRRLIFIALFLAFAICQGREIGYIEKFSLADDRALALSELVPGTDDYHYFHALHAQNMGNHQGFQTYMNKWIKECNGKVNVRARELLNRQALLDYERDPQKSLNYLKHEIGVHFVHARKTGERDSRAPSVLNNALIATERLLQQALSEDPRSLERIEDVGLTLAAGKKINDEQRRNLLSRLRRPDFPFVVELIVADLACRDSRGFGSLSVHNLLTLAQMDALLQLRPSLRNEAAFVSAYLAKLVPENEADIDTDTAVRESYLDRLCGFVRTLDPVHNSLKAHVFYNRLRHDLCKGVLDRARFMEYVKLPRNVNYLRPEYRERVPHSNQIAQLNRDFSLIALSPVPAEEPLVRRFLLEFFKTDNNYDAFAPYMRDDFLKPLFAEAKIVNGIGEPQQWASLLTPEAYKRLKERVDIDFLEDNPDVFSSESKVALKANVKNVSALLIKIYEINTFNYYCETGKPLNLAINLDGLVASVTRREKFSDPAEHRVERVFEMPEINGPGVYVVELIGNGKSSRALVQKGRLDVLQEVTAAGHAFTVLDERGHKVAGVEAWLSGRSFSGDESGRVIVPFSTAPGDERIVVRKDNFATLVRFQHLAEKYVMKAGAYIDREALIRREKALITLRPVLTLNGRPVSLKLLEKPILVVRSLDLRGIATVQEFADLKLREDSETVQEIKVPENAMTMQVTLKASVQNLSLNRKLELVDVVSFGLNGIERTSAVYDLHACKTADGYFVELRGKNGETLTEEPLFCIFKHRQFRNEVHAELKTDKRGRVTLGALKDVERFRVRAPSGAEQTWHTMRDTCAHQSILHGRTGEILRIPVVWKTTAEVTDEVSLIETRHGEFIKDWREALSVNDGFLELSGLPAGDYSLFLKSFGTELTVRVTQGEASDGRVVSFRRVLELPRLAPLNITSVTPEKTKIKVRLANATQFSRVHLFVTRYLPAYDLPGHLGYSGLPALSQQMLRPARTFYESGRDIGDEYRYILDRQQATKFPGNMLERPGLLLNPWTLRTTEAEVERLAAGGVYAGRDAAVAKAELAKSAASEEAQALLPGGYASLDFLRQPCVAILNLVPDPQGNLEIPRAALKGLPCLRVLAVDPASFVMRCVALEETPMDTRDLRLVNGLDPQKAYSAQKQVTVMLPDAEVAVDDVTTSKFEKYDTVAKIYRLMANLNPDATFGEFAFIVDWPGLPEAERERLYSKYACHELSFFLYYKDPAFFEKVIAPFLKNKKDKTFLDKWLLGDDLRGYLESWRFERLNAAERVLLEKRLREHEASLRRDTRERAEMIPPDMEAFNRRFDTAVQVSAMDAEGSGISDDITMIRENAVAAGLRGLARLEAPKASVALSNESKLAVFKPGRAAKAPAISNGRSFSALDAKKEKSVMLADKADMEQSEELDLEPTVTAQAETFFMEDMRAEREAVRRFYQKMDKTQELAENNYYRRRIKEHTAALVQVNAFWRDYAEHDGKTPFVSAAFPEATSNFTEMMMALAVLNVPFKSAEHTQKTAGTGYAIKAGSPLLFFHSEIRETGRDVKAGSVLVAQHFFRADDRERFENNERFDKLVTEEFLPQVVYGAQLVLTNPTGNRQKLNVLLQIPWGALPVNNGFYTRGHYLVLEPYSTQTQEYYFYFPTTGVFPHYPVTLSADGKVVGSADLFTFNVVANLSRTDKTSWAWLSQNGSDDEVLEFLNTSNLHRLDLTETAWRMNRPDTKFFKRAMMLLESRHFYHDTLWSYGFLHNAPQTIREYLRHSPFAARCGLWLESPLLRLEPVERFDYQHLEYAPLVNPRAHLLGDKRMILNKPLREQYQLFMKVLSYKPRPDAVDILAVSYYLALQDRVEEALRWYKRVDRTVLPEQIQCDYLEAYLAFYTGDLEKAEKLAAKHAEHGVRRWRYRFAQVLTQLEEIRGRNAAVVDGENREQAQGVLAATEPFVGLQVEAGRIRLDTRNVRECKINFYPMDIELLFSRNPFMQEGAAQFSFIRPLLSQTVVIADVDSVLSLDLPPEFKVRNVMVEAVAGGVRKAQAYYANTLKVQMIENYGQLNVTNAESGKAVPGAYVKVYAKTADNKVKFFKDGYTDLRGRFDYASLNADDMDTAVRLAVLVLSEEFGAVVRETAPPKR